ncbi:MAG: hypothetical protein ACOCUI_04965 [bacterium]
MEETLTNDVEKFNLNDKYNELKGIADYKKFTENELKQYIIEKSLREGLPLEDDQLNLELAPTIKTKLQTIDEELSSYKEYDNKSEEKIRTDTPLKDFLEVIKELNIDLTKLNSESIFNKKDIDNIYRNFINKYYYIRYNKLIRFFIELFGYKDKFIGNIPALSTWKEKIMNLNFNLFPYNLSSTPIYKKYIFNKNKKSKNHNTIIELLKSLINDMKSIIVKYSIIQSNSSYLNELNIKDFGDDYYHNLLLSLGNCIQLYKMFISLTSYTDIKAPEENKIKADHIIPLLEWVRDVWKSKFDEGLILGTNENISETDNKADILQNLKQISENIYNKLPEETEILKNITLTIPELTKRIKENTSQILDNIMKVETTVFLLYLKDFSSKNSIEVTFTQSSKGITILQMKKKK